MPKSPPIAQIKSLSYEVVENPEGWKRYGYVTEGGTYVCILDLKKNYKHILQTLERFIPRNKIGLLN